MSTNTMFCLRGIYPSLTPIERRLADYFFENAKDLPQTPMLVVAQACDTSKPAVVRLCKKMGFTGYKEFLITLSAEMAISAMSERPDFTTLSRQSSAKDICAAVAYWQIASLEDTVLQVNTDNMEEAVKLVMAAKRIDLCGIGSGTVSAQAAGLGLSRLGMDAHVCGDTEEQGNRVSSFEPNDVMIVLSDTEVNKALLKSAEEARELGAKVIAILRRHTPAVAHACDVVIQYASADAPEEFCAIATRTAMLCTVDMLVTLTISRGNEQMVEHWDRLRVQRNYAGRRKSAR